MFIYPESLMKRISQIILLSHIYIRRQARAARFNDRKTIRIKTQTIQSIEYLKIKC